VPNLGVQADGSRSKAGDVMTTTDARRQRRSIRLPTFDYGSGGAYFITIVTHDRLPLFGDVLDGQMQLNERGRVVEEAWTQTAIERAEIELDAFVVMPNHVHGIVWITRDEDDSSPPQHPPGTPPRAPTATAASRRFGAMQPRSLSAMVNGFKGSVTRRLRLVDEWPERVVWQRNYYERVIRDDEELGRIRQYILDNPRQWTDDEENPDAGTAGRSGP
jgi:REP element-mobilizing transposase RayT